MLRLLQICAVMCCAAACVEVCRAQDFHVPESAVAGDDAVISTAGSGKATVYLIGPGVSRKDEITLGEDVRLAGQDVRNAGEYLAILCSGTCRGANFYVSAAKPTSLTFLVHPSRVPVAQGDAVSGVAFPFDPYHNLVLSPENINFQIMAKDASSWSRSIRTQNGVAWFRTASGKSAGPVQVLATLGDLKSRRVLQQVASDPCNLRISWPAHAHRHRRANRAGSRLHGKRCSAMARLSHLQQPGQAGKAQWTPQSSRELHARK